jgi:hypothetical protein
MFLYGTLPLSGPLKSANGPQSETYSVYIFVAYSNID